MGYYAWMDEMGHPNRLKLSRTEFRFANPSGITEVMGNIATFSFSIPPGNPEWYVTPPMEPAMKLLPNDVWCLELCLNPPMRRFRDDGQIKM